MSICFNYLERKLKKDVSQGATISIIFLTDGDGDDPDNKERLKLQLARASKEKDIQSRVYALGLSTHHDATLLSFIG